ncbi:hypothetical protein C1147_00960 [Clostridium botulinum]|nr:hypothetical protein C1147_00960 [Clostridium botulinum]
MADGKIIIDTKIDSSGAEKGLQKVKASVRSQAASLAAEYRKQGMSASEAMKKHGLKLSEIQIQNLKKQH